MSGGEGRLLAALPLLLAAAAEVALCNSEAMNCTPSKGIKGEDITLTPIFTGVLSETTWKKEVDKQFNKVAEWDGSLTLYSHLENRAGIDPGSGNLTIKNISSLDDGKYKAEVLVKGRFQDTYLCLKTLEPPSAPTLTCNIDDDGIYVHCMSVTGYELPLSLEWKYINMKVISVVNSTKEHPSVKLPKNTDLSRNITCTIVASKSYVSNTISLMTCDSKGAVSQKRTRSIAVIAVVIILLGIGLTVFILWKKGIFTRLQGERNPENQIAQSSIGEDVGNCHQESLPLVEGPENESSEVHPENHTDESRPSDEPSEPERQTTSSREDVTTPES